MATKEQEKSSVIDLVKILLSVGLLIGGPIVLNIYHITSGPAKIGAILGLVLLAIVIFLTSNKGKASWEFMKEARIEVRKVIWPTQKETLQTTLIVIVMAIAIGLLLFVFDQILGTIFNWLG
jgi:preprotein translocase subunit SecE